MAKSIKKHNGNNSGDTFGSWTLIEFIGAGGNGDVWKASQPNQPPHAIKILKGITTESYERFKIETEALERLGHLDGIVPLIDKHIPSKKEVATPWFVMPLATPFSDYIKGKSHENIVRDFLDLAEVIKELHAENISHRDIKPANFLFLNDRLCLSDFGLVKYPDRKDLTKQKRDIGAKFTMAPEMRRIAHRANGLPADVYSLSKSLWIALTGEELGFDGQYSLSSTLALKNYLKDTYTSTLDQLLAECTDTEPDRRPTITRFIFRLEEWLELINDFHTRNLTEWSEVTQKLFPLGAPSRATWTEIDDICAVLSEVAKIPSLNHMFYPTGGGNTITGVSRSEEEGTIELRIGEKMAEILKPKKLTYESFGNDTSWSYFRLEADEIEPTGIDAALGRERIDEALTEIVPGQYIPYYHWDNNEFNDEPLPDSARPVSRFLKGSFVFFSTRSAYNLNPGTYDARHHKMNEKEFRRYIERNAKQS